MRTVVVKIVTNNVPRDVIDAWKLTRDASNLTISIGTRSTRVSIPRHSFGSRVNCDLGEFSADYYGITKGNGLPAHIATWDGYMSKHAFSALVIRWVDDRERVIVGRVLS